jgi:hypothetical protein
LLGAAIGGLNVIFVFMDEAIRSVWQVSRAATLWAAGFDVAQRQQRCITWSDSALCVIRASNMGGKMSTGSYKV